MLVAALLSMTQKYGETPIVRTNEDMRNSGQLRVSQK